MNKFNQLSRSEMKNVVGGKGLATCTFNGSCTAYTGAPTQNYDPQDTGVANNMQADADTWCLARACCTGADCSGATA